MPLDYYTGVFADFSEKGETMCLFLILATIVAAVLGLILATIGAFALVVIDILAFIFIVWLIIKICRE